MNLPNISQLVQDVHDGNESPLKAYGIIKEVQKYVETCVKEIESSALNEAQRWDEKQFDTDGFHFEKRNGSARYDFSGIEEYNRVKDNLKQLEEKYKVAFRSWQKGITPVDDETGEVIPQPKVTYSKDVLIVKSTK